MMALRSIKKKIAISIFVFAAITSYCFVSNAEDIIKYSSVGGNFSDYASVSVSGAKSADAYIFGTVKYLNNDGMYATGASGWDRGILTYKNDFEQEFTQEKTKEGSTKYDMKNAGSAIFSKSGSETISLNQSTANTIYTRRGSWHIDVNNVQGEMKYRYEISTLEYGIPNSTTTNVTVKMCTNHDYADCIWAGGESKYHKKVCRTCGHTVNSACMIATNGKCIVCGHDYGITQKVLGVNASYTGSPVPERDYAKKSDFTFIVNYADSTSATVPGTADSIRFGSLKITDPNNGTVIHYAYTDPTTHETINGSLTVPCSERGPKSLGVSYTAEEVTKGTEFSLSNVVVSVIYADDSITRYRANSSQSIGIYTSDEWKFEDLGDIDLNGVLNDYDVRTLTLAIKGSGVLSGEQKIQADINRDSVIDGKDLEILTSRISKVCNSKKNNFYVAYAGLNDGIKPIYAGFSVNAVEKKPYNVVINTKPAYTEYGQGQDIDVSGLTLTVYYDDGSIKYIPVTGYASPDGVQVGDKDHPVRSLQTDQKEMVVYYIEGDYTFRMAYSIIVQSHLLTAVKVEQMPTTTVYYDGENFKPAGMKVSAYYDELNNAQPVKESVAISACKFENDTKMPSSVDRVIIKNDAPENDEQRYISIPVEMITENPGLSVGSKGTYKYDDGSEIKSVKGTLVGNYLVKVTYSYKGVTQFDYVPVTVNEARMSELALQSMPTKTTYFEGQPFESTGLVLRALYSNGTSKLIYEDRGEGGFVIVGGAALTSLQNSVQAVYVENGVTKTLDVGIRVTDPNIARISAEYVGSNVYKGKAFSPSNVVVTIEYSDGHLDSVSGAMGSITPVTASGNSIAGDTTVYDVGVNLYQITLSGQTDTFTVTGIDIPDSMKFNSTANGKSYYSTWTETFAATEVKAVQDYIRGSIGTNGQAPGEDFTPDADISTNTFHVVNKDDGADAREYLDYASGTGKGFDPTGDTVVPLLNFMREANEPIKERIIEVMYRGRTEGYLFPDTAASALAQAGSGAYIDAYGQEQSGYSSSAAISGGVGWSDWVKNGDSIGTVKSERIIYNRPNKTEERKFLQAISVKLSNAPASADISIQVEHPDGTVSSGTTNTIFMNPARIKMNLTGMVNGESFHNEYKLYYRASNDDNVAWSSEGEWAGVAENRMETLEIQLVLATDEFDSNTTLAGPRIVYQSKDQTCYVGEDVEFNVAVAGQDDSANYQWYKNDLAIPGANGSSYKYETAQLEDNGSIFRCQVDFVSGGSISTDSMRLTVKDVAPVFTKNLPLEPVEMAEGSTGCRLEVEAVSISTLSNDITFCWFESKDGVAWTPMAGTDINGTSYIDVNVNATTDGSYYKCEATNVAGTTVSNVATIVCKDLASAKIEPSRGSINNNVVTVAKDSGKVILTCTTKGMTDILKYTWTVDGKYAGSENTISFIPEAEGTHSVKCTIKYGRNVIDAEYSVNVITPDAIAVSTEKSVSGSVYEVTLHCTNAQPGDVIKWYYGSSVVTGKEDSITLSADGTGVTIKNITDLRETVTVKVSNDFGTQTKSVVLRDLFN